MKRADCPLVSIVTIVYNGERYIADTIRSVAAQSYPNIEYIVVDGGSTDGTLEIAGRFKDTISTIITEKDRGISDAFNKGVRIARGEIIGIINADDWYEPNAVAMAVEYLAGSDVAYGDLRQWSEEKAEFIVRGDHHLLTREMTVNHPTVFVRRECYQRFGLFDEQYKCAMDYDLVLRLFRGGCRFIHVPAVLANMRWGGMSDFQWKLGCRETLQIKNKYLPSRRILNRLYYYKHILAIRLQKILKAIRLRFVP
jgi:glycosyltransferase involved in cell wall biosynthesis